MRLREGLLPCAEPFSPSELARSEDRTWSWAYNVTYSTIRGLHPLPLYTIAQQKTPISGCFCSQAHLVCQFTHVSVRACDVCVCVCVC